MFKYFKFLPCNTSIVTGNNKAYIDNESQYRVIAYLELADTSIVLYSIVLVQYKIHWKVSVHFISRKFISTCTVFEVPVVELLFCNYCIVVSVSTILINVDECKY